MTTTLKRRTQRRTDDGVYQRNYKWNERNLLSESSDSSYTVQYRYGADGQRAIKYVLNTGKSTLYFNRMWQTNDTREAPVQSKHIYMGETRIATKNSATDNPNTLDESKRIYYYHSDHLGSARTVTNYRGDVHERLEYTPYGELWIDWKSSTDGDKTPFRFTGKERDEETGLYYYGARYMDPRTSRWLTADPAMYQGDYIPSAPINDEARKRNGNLPGQGGIFNTVNMHVYHYAGNNPVKYVDPDGRESGYVRRKDSVGGMGHAGVFVKRMDGKYAFTEIIPIEDRDYTYNPDIITKEGNLSTGGGIIGVFYNKKIGAVEYTFDKKKEMLEFFRKNGFDDYIEFYTTPKQDAAIRDAAYLLGREYKDYNIPGNHCGVFAEKALDAGGKGIRTDTNNRDIRTTIALARLITGNIPVKAISLYDGIRLQSPNAIGEQLMRLNYGTLVKIE